MQALPFLDEKEHRKINLLIVQALPTESKVTDSGIFIPIEANEDCEEGTVITTCAGSIFKPGDRVVYKKIDRSKKENFETVEIDGNTYDIIAENEVWEVNGQPYNRIFVLPVSASSLTESTLIVPEDVEHAIQHGIVFMAPENYSVKKGDKVEYRMNTMGIYHNADIDGVSYDILYEPDIFTINGGVAPHKIIVKIDLAAQSLKRQTNEMGVTLSPLFQRMTMMLQYGEVIAIGDEAQKIYPELNAGNTAILHHSVEYDQHRLLKIKRGKHAFTHEYRIINCFDLSHREIFGRLDYKKLDHGASHFNIVPFHKNVFLEWNFDLFEQTSPVSTVIDIDFSLNDCHNKEELELAVNQKREASVELYKSKWGGYNADLALYDPHIKEDNDRMRIIGSKIEALKREAAENAAYTQKDHILKCKIAFPKQEENVVFTNYKYLYPINLLGKKFLIAHSDFLIAKQMNTTPTGWQPIADRVLVKPVAEVNTSEIYIPEEAKEAPQQGLVIATGADVDASEIQEGDTIYHRKIAGAEITIDGVGYIMLRRNDIFMSKRPNADNSVN